MLQAITAARVGKSQVVTECLQRLAEIVDDINSILQRMDENCDPYVFYNRVRPYLAGSKNMADSSLPKGLLYDTGRGNPKYHQYGGGSNAQSSLLQFFDIVLGVKHRPTGVDCTDQDPIQVVMALDHGTILSMECANICRVRTESSWNMSKRWLMFTPLLRLDVVIQPYVLPTIHV
jgi:hypothetical protein